MSLHRREFLASGALFMASARLGADASPDAAPRSSAEGPDGVRWVTLASGHKLWTRRVGAGPSKLLLLHGGPGLSHDYLECFADFLPQAGYELYFYDQLGCGRSDKPDDASLWTLPRYLQEVEEVRTSLGLDRFTLVGHISMHWCCPTCRLVSVTMRPIHGSCGTSCRRP
jgi:proline iminopeptidase